jgi:four helix bundle protein
VGAMTVNSHHDLQVWQKAIDLVLECYSVTRQFPETERYGLTSQLQRAAVSIPANIAEGHGRGSTKSFINFLWIANGSLKELDTHLTLALRLEYIQESQLQRALRLADEVGRMLVGLRRSLERRQT